jgi:hypothetical protein
MIFTTSVYIISTTTTTPTAPITTPVPILDPAGAAPPVLLVACALDEAFVDPSLQVVAAAAASPYSNGADPTPVELKHTSSPSVSAASAEKVISAH